MYLFFRDFGTHVEVLRVFNQQQQFHDVIVTRAPGHGIHIPHHAFPAAAVKVTRNDLQVDQRTQTDSEIVVIRDFTQLSQQRLLV